MYRCASMIASMLYFLTQKMNGVTALTTNSLRFHLYCLFFFFFHIPHFYFIWSCQNLYVFLFEPYLTYFLLSFSLILFRSFSMHRFSISIFVGRKMIEQYDVRFCFSTTLFIRSSL